MARSFDISGNVRFKGLERGLPLIIKETHKRFEKLWYDAARASVRRMASPDMIRVLTGMSKGSLLPLSRKLKIFSEVRSTISPTSKPRKGYWDIAGNFISSGTQSILTGERLGERAFVLDVGSPDKPVFKFEFRIVVYQYLLHENGFVPGSGPWRSLDNGFYTFETFIAENWRRYMPDFLRYFLTGDIRNG